ncbi:MAG: tetratricopeptide repeat protein [Burkholderiales bacterium]|nr:tetratricopeptide repeat protein [Bacteroidia bacterium]
MNKYITVIFCLGNFLCFSQTKIDSLIKLINVAKHDTEIINLNFKLMNEYSNTDPNKAVSLAKQNLILCKKNIFKLYKGYSHYAYYLSITLNLKDALINYQFAEKECEKTIDLNERDKQLAYIYDRLGSINSNLQNHSKAIAYSKKAIYISEQLNDKSDIAKYNINAANYYFLASQIDSALEHYKIAEKGYLQINDSINLQAVFNGFGNAYFEKKDYKKALEYFQKSYTLILKLTPNDLSNIAIAYENIGETSAKMGDYNLGLANCLKAQNIFKQLNDKTSLYITYESIAKIYEQLGEFQKSNDYLKKYVNLKDSVFDEDTKNTIHEMSEKYESDKKEKENLVLTLENKNKSQIIYFALGGCLLLFGLVFFIYRGYRIKQKANHLLEEKNEIINHQKHLVEEQHQDITDSIKYAQRIQGAILPPKNMWEKILPSSFVLYMPKDILSGDFYWIEETEDYIYVAAADCTGHGVPGALISIVNFNLLNKAVLEKKLVTPSEILDTVNILLTESLHQTIGESAVRDGMDVALIAIHKHSNEVLFSGANNPIYIVSHGELKQIKGDKFPVGAFVEDQMQKFTTKRFTVEKGDSIYLFSDGFADQFGGEKGKKYKYNPFQEKLKEITDLPLIEQSGKMEAEFLKWKGNHEQVDDVLLIGIKIG